MRQVVAQALEHSGFRKGDVLFWAIHPGGRRILEAVEHGLGIDRSKTTWSWEVLQENGNMLGPSVFFVLKKMLGAMKPDGQFGTPEGKLGVALSFAPGVRAEGFVFRVMPKRCELKSN
ncbi:unnamed protein product [Ostreobium quekettii]|uniref:Chalcone/stilbene synthase C-terminal domain-containing protein n=1 Tax=Ostreobium quekettii TaxID=121088 RepID=A0A8S1J798_9CHLO|nr:unnamed protein product [Ostreobium quekettii]